MNQNISGKLVFAFALCIALFALPAEAQDQDKAVIGVVKGYARAGQIRQSACYLASEGSRRLPAGEALIVVGIETCRMPYGGRAEEFYQIALRGELAFVEAASLSVSADDIERLKSMPPEVRAAQVDLGKRVSAQVYADTLRSAIEAIEKTSSKGVALINYGLHDVSEHTEGTGFSFRVANSTKKTIKYITATFTALNAVRDPVRTLRGSTTVTLRGVGPIEPDQTASYSWDYVWHTDLPEYVRWISMKVDYMDGTSRVLSKPDDVLIDPKHVKVIYEKED